MSMQRLFVVALAGVMLTGCAQTAQEHNALTGAAVGAGTGALIGGLATGRAGGALAGAAIGGATGGIVGAAATPPPPPEICIVRDRRGREREVPCE
jgi:osmotically inducible lipoprotein OsmB